MAHEEDELAREDLQGSHRLSAGFFGWAGYVFVTWSKVMTGAPVAGGHLVHFEHGQSLGQLGGHATPSGRGRAGRRRAGARVVALGRRAGVTAGMTRNSLVPLFVTACSVRVVRY